MQGSAHLSPGILGMKGSGSHTAWEISLEHLQAQHLWAPSPSWSFQVSRTLRASEKGQALVTVSQAKETRTVLVGLLVRDSLPRQQIKELLQKTGPEP